MQAKENILRHPHEKGRGPHPLRMLRCTRRGNVTLAMG